MSIVKKIIENSFFKNLSFLVSDNLIKLALGFIISVFLARYFGVENFGKINYILAFLGFYEVFINFGIDGILLKEIGLNKERTSEILNGIILFRVLMYFLSFPLWLYIFKFFNKDTELIKLYLIGSISPLVNTFISLKYYYQVEAQNKVEVLVSQISFVICFILKIVLIKFKLEMFLYFLVLIFEKIIYSSLLWGHFFRHKKYKFVINFKLIKKIIKESFPLLLASFSIFVYMKIDQIMVGKMVSIKQVGIYSVGVRFAELLYFIPGAILTASFPKILKEKEKSEDNFKNILVKIGTINIIIMTILGGMLYIFSTYMMAFFYGNEYLLSAKVLKIYAWTGIFVSLGLTHTNYLVFKNKNKYSLYSTLIGAALNIILNIILINMMGIVGAAIATLISQSFVSLFFYFFIKEKEHINMRLGSFNILWLKEYLKNE